MAEEALDQQMQQILGRAGLDVTVAVARMCKSEVQARTKGDHASLHECYSGVESACSCSYIQELK